jgi:hypothetical protein
MPFAERWGADPERTAQHGGKMFDKRAGCKMSILRPAIFAIFLSLSCKNAGILLL